MTRRLKILIEGRVQGVFFRASAVRIAQSLSLAGFVRNLPGGCVEVVAEGEEHLLKRLLDWCRKGPPGAKVVHVTVEWSGNTDEFDGFDVQ